MVKEDFYPLDFDNYILIQPYSKPAKSFDYFADVVAALAPVLNTKNIKIIQIGGQNEVPIPGCHLYLQGMTTISQIAYLVKNAKLVLGVDSFALHLAGNYNIPCVGLYSTNYLECVKPYFGDKSKQILLEPDRRTKKPSFSYEENPKQINEIKPEIIAESVLKLLDFKVKIGFESLYFGVNYTKRIFETIPDQIIDPATLNLASLIVRMDLLFNENNLQQQLMRGKVSIVTNKEINFELLNHFKKNILELVYIVEENDNAEFAAKASKLGFPFHLMTFLPPEEVQKKKINYMDIGVIHNKRQSQPEETKNKTNLIFKTNKFLLSDGKIYLSKAHWLEKKETRGFEQNYGDVIDNQEFWNETDYFYIGQKI